MVQKLGSLGYIKDNRQGFIDTPTGQPTNKTYLEIEAQVQVHCQNAIPRGVRFQMPVAVSHILLRHL